ncbi:MAG: MFS transporter [Nocardioidaceae bacterium]
MSRLVELMVPARLGPGFRWLLASSWVSNLGDGLMTAAGPLLVASQTHNPVLVAAAAMSSQLPWLLFGLVAGALADRLDRRVVVIIVDSLRTVVMVGLCVVIVTGRVDIWLVMASMFALGTAEVFADVTTSTLTPMLVEKADLGIANARIQTGFVTVNQFAGPALGAVLFAAGMVLPFAVQATCVALGAVLVGRIGTPKGAVREHVDTHVWHDIVEGVGWVKGNRPVRTLALVIVTFNITWAAPWSVLVLWALQRVGIGEAGFGLLTSAVALGGLLGTVSYGRLERWVPLALLMRLALLSEVLFHLLMALTTSPWAAYPLMFFFGAYAFVWGTLSNAVRMRAVPTEFQGRVGSVYMVCVMGGMLLGSFLGGVIAQEGGIVAPWWFAFVGSALTLALVWRELGHIAHADEQATAAV